MKLKVPFTRNLKKWKGNGWCGPLALNCILSYYEVKSNVPDIFSKARSKIGCPPNGLANYCINKGMKVEHITKNARINNNTGDYSKGYIKFIKDVEAEKYEKRYYALNKKSKNFTLIKKYPSQKDIDSNLNQKKPILLMLNVAVIYHKKKTWPHYVTIVGYDKNNYYIHNVYPKNLPFQRVPKNLLLKAWKSMGSDMNIIIPYF